MSADFYSEGSIVVLNQGCPVSVLFCNYCDFQCSGDVVLLKHMRAVHENVNPTSESSAHTVDRASESGTH